MLPALSAHRVREAFGQPLLEVMLTYWMLVRRDRRTTISCCSRLTAAFGEACSDKSCLSYELLPLLALWAAEPHQRSQVGPDQLLPSELYCFQAPQPTVIQAHSRTFHSWEAGSLECLEPTEGRCLSMPPPPQPHFPKDFKTLSQDELIF